MQERWRKKNRSWSFRSFNKERILLFVASKYFVFSNLKKMSESFQISLNPFFTILYLLCLKQKPGIRKQKHLISLSRNINSKFYHNWQSRSKWPLTLLVKTRKDQFDTFLIRYGAVSNVTETKNCSSNVFLYRFVERDVTFAVGKF